MPGMRIISSFKKNKALLARRIGGGILSDVLPLQQRIGHPRSL